MALPGTEFVVTHQNHQSFRQTFLYDFWAATPIGDEMLYKKQVRSNKDASKKFLFKKMVLKFCFKILF